jgi:hypothetical protein
LEDKNIIKKDKRRERERERERERDIVMWCALEGRERDIERWEMIW